jgi:hypothetical protein
MIMMEAMLLVAAAVATGNVYVSPKGSDSNDGSAGHPFATLEKAKEVRIGGLLLFCFPF